MWTYNYSNELYHHGVKGQKWGVRRYQNSDGSLTKAGRERQQYDRLVRSHESLKSEIKYRTKVAEVSGDWPTRTGVSENFKKVLNELYAARKPVEDEINKLESKMRKESGVDNDYADWRDWRDAYARYENHPGQKRRDELTEEWTNITKQFGDKAVSVVASDLNLVVSERIIEQLRDIVVY